MAVDITYDEALIEEIAARFDLRDPNKNALATIVQRIADGSTGFQEMVADLATGVATNPTMLPTLASVALPFFATEARMSGRNFAVTITGEMTFVS